MKICKPTVFNGIALATQIIFKGQTVWGQRSGIVTHTYTFSHLKFCTGEYVFSDFNFIAVDFYDYESVNKHNFLGQAAPTICLLTCQHP